MGISIYLLLLSAAWALALSGELPGGLLSAVFLFGLSLGVLSRLLDDWLFGLRAKKLRVLNKSRYEKLRDQLDSMERAEAIIESLELAAVPAAQEILDWFEEPGKGEE